MLDEVIAMKPTIPSLAIIATMLMLAGSASAYAADAANGAGAWGGAPVAMVKTGSAGFSARGRIRWARKGGSGSMARLSGVSGNSLAVISVVSVRTDGLVKDHQTSSAKRA